MTVGIVGAGQLGRMLALAGYPLGLDFPVPGPGAAMRRPARSRRCCTARSPTARC